MARFSLKNLLLAFNSSPSYEVMLAIVSKLKSESDLTLLELGEQIEQFFDTILRQEKNMSSEQIERVRAGVRSFLSAKTNCGHAHTAGLFLDLVWKVQTMLLDRSNDQDEADDEILKNEVFECFQFFNDLVSPEVQSSVSQADLESQLKEVEWPIVADLIPDSLKTMSSGNLEKLADEYEQLIGLFNNPNNQAIFIKLKIKDKVNSMRNVVVGNQPRVLAEKNKRRLLRIIRDVFEYHPDVIGWFVRVELVERLGEMDEKNLEKLIGEAKFCVALNDLSELIGKRVKTSCKSSRNLVLGLRKVFVIPTKSKSEYLPMF